MEQTSSSTLERIHLAAKAEFLEKGYQAASLQKMLVLQLVLFTGIMIAKRHFLLPWWTSPISI